MDNLCLMCGEIIPEGIMVCPSCERRIMGDDAPVYIDDKQYSGLLTEEG